MSFLDNIYFDRVQEAVHSGINVHRHIDKRDDQHSSAPFEVTCGICVRRSGGGGGGCLSPCIKIGNRVSGLRAMY